MPRFAWKSMQGLEMGLEYQNTGKVTGFYCVNNTGKPVNGRAVLTDRQPYQQAFGAGDTVVPFPQNKVSVTFTNGEPTWSGIAHIEIPGVL